LCSIKTTRAFGFADLDWEYYHGIRMKIAPRFLIDGYNVLYALGLPPGPLGPRGLQRARSQFLNMLADALKRQAATATVVFDAHHPPPGSPGEEQVGPVHVLYAIQHEEADELIEALIRHDASPRRLSVVSNDHRVQRAAAHRRCLSLSCDEFLDWLETKPKDERRRKPADAEPRAIQSEEERDHWLKEFADLETNPAFREVFRRFDFEED
jgi:predicted RNA-binding protein with PIN domain